MLPVPANCGATEVLAVGLGAGADSADDAADDQLRTAAGSVARTLVAKAKSHALSAIFAPAALGVAAATEGLHLGGYEIPRPAGGRTSMSQSVTITLPLADSTASEDSDEANYRHAVISSEAVIAARDLVNCPANLLYPESYAQQLQQLEQLGVTVTVLDEKQLADEGFGGIISVGQGSTRPPRLVKLDWAPESTTRQVAFVGKGITFDTGGISIKPASNMENMISDMGGSAAVVASVAAAAALNIPVHLTGWVALAENMPDGGATRPGDVVTAYDGHTIEVQFHALAGDGATDLHHDATAGEVENVEALDERHDEDAAAHDHLLCAQVSGDLTGLWIGDGLPLLAGDDVGLVGARHLVAAGDQPDEEDDEQYCSTNPHYQGW